MGGKNVGTPKPKGKQQPELTRDDAARIAAIAVNVVCEQLQIRQIVEGITVLPAGDSVLMIDIVMRNLQTNQTWATSMYIPPVKDQADDRE